MTTVNSTSFSGLRVLYVEDDALQRQQLSDYLRRKFAELWVATNGKEGLDKFHEIQPDIVISDLEMPLMNGLEMAQEIKASDRDVPVILTTGISDSEHLLDAIDIGIDNYVVKPVNPRRLLQTVEKSVEVLLARREIAAQNERLQQLNDQKNEFLGIAAHDIRNPIGVIKGYADFILMLGDTPQHTQILERIRNSADFVQRLLEDLLDVSKIEAGQLNLHSEVTDFVSVVQTTVDLNRVFADQKQITIATQHNADSVELSFDRDKIEQVLNNLLSNAIKYSPAGSKVVVAVSASDDDVTVAVIDHGPGIPVAELGVVFQEFTSTSVQTTGGEKSTGLGLAIARKIVDGHGGRIGVESTVGVGTTFHFSLPR